LLLPVIEGKWSIRAIASHARAFRRLRPDVVHVNVNVTGASPWAILAARAARSARVVAVEHLPHPIRRRRRLLARITSKLLAAHVAVGERSAEDTARFIGVPAASLRVIANGVPDVDLAQLPRPVAGPIVGSLGRLEEQKAYDVLVRALPGLPTCSVAIVGEGRERERLVRLAESLGVSDRLVLHGWSDEARRYLTTFDVFVLPSRSEGLPLAVIEAMLARLPVVASDVGDMGEIVEDGVTGILVQPDDPPRLAAALETLLRDPERRNAMGERGRRRALDLFAVEAMASRYEELYGEVLA
jgi:glycosyltransferase involved in cell wall biosynthesis